jgi:hypothetical protein
MPLAGAGFNILDKHGKGRQDGLKTDLLRQLHSRWSYIDVGWVRIDVGFQIAKELSSTCPEAANRFLTETEQLKNQWTITAHRPANAYVACIRLVIRAFSGLFKKKVETDADIDALAVLIGNLPSYGERALLWADACMRATLNGRQDLAERLANAFLKPSIDGIPAVDT